MNKASGGDRIPAKLSQILKDDAVKALNSICQQICKTQKWPQNWKMSVLILNAISSLLPYYLGFSLPLNKASGGDGIPVELFQILKDVAALNIPASLENTAVTTGLEKVSLHSNPKERQCQRMFSLSHNCTHFTC